MSDNVNRDIQNAINDAQGNGVTNDSTGTVIIPNPKILQHSVQEGEVSIPAPRKLKESKENK